MKLQSAVDLINQTVGDAISDLLLVEAILSSQGWSAADWDLAYTDLPNRQLKVKVRKTVWIGWSYRGHCIVLIESHGIREKYE